MVDASRGLILPAVWRRDHVLKEIEMMKKTGQVILEYTFCLIVILLFLYGVIMALRWAGLSLAQRRVDHETTLTQDINENWVTFFYGPGRQVSSDFAQPVRMNMVFNRW